MLKVCVFKLIFFLPVIVFAFYYTNFVLEGTFRFLVTVFFQLTLKLRLFRIELMSVLSRLFSYSYVMYIVHFHFFATIFDPPPQNYCLQNAMSDCLTGKYEKVRLLGRGTFGEAWLVNSKVSRAPIYE